MRKVKIKELYRNLSKELKELPFLVTRGGKVVARVSLDEKVPETAEKGESDLELGGEVLPEEVVGEKFLKVEKLGLRGAYKLSHPRDICSRCLERNERCVCDD